MDDNGHGTHCSGTIGAVHNNGIGVAGVMFNVKIMGIKFLTGSGSGDTADAIKSIEYATAQNVDVMSNSWGGGGYSKLLGDAIQNAANKGIIFVAAAGNSYSNNDSKPTYPANYEIDNMISVAAMKSNGKKPWFSNYGKTTVHVMAPGAGVYSTYQNSYKSLDGTSMAAPHVSGLIGLLLQYEGARLSPLEVRNRIIETSFRTSKLKKYTVSGGRVDAYRLLMNERN